MLCRSDEIQESSHWARAHPADPHLVDPLRVWMAVGYVLAGLICCILIVTIPFGVASFRIANYALRPFGRTAVRDRRLAQPRPSAMSSGSSSLGSGSRSAASSPASRCASRSSAYRSALQASKWCRSLCCRWVPRSRHPTARSLLVEHRAGSCPGDHGATRLIVRHSNGKGAPPPQRARRAAIQIDRQALVGILPLRLMRDA